MAANRVLSLVVFMILSKLKDVQSYEVWQKEQFPNPARDIEACGRQGRVSWICDPDKILSYETANFVEELLSSVRKYTYSGCSYVDGNPGFQIGVAVMKKMRGIPGESIAVTAENFAKHLHDRWGVGNAGCDDGAVFLLSITDRQVYVSTGRRAKKVLTDNQIDFLIELIEPFLEGKYYDISVKVAVERMRQVFNATKKWAPKFVIKHDYNSNNNDRINFSDGQKLAIFFLISAVYSVWLYQAYHSSSCSLREQHFKLLMSMMTISWKLRRSFGRFGGGGSGFGGGGSIGGGGRGGSW
ncbi:hypothetical protein ABFA07_018258 [Porites harrisoni]